MKLMIVDDHAGMRAMIRDIVGPMATQVRECASGEEAVATCGAFAPDFITMDLRLNVMPGLEAAQAICARHPHVKFLVVTQFNHVLLKERALRAGASGFVCKDDLGQLKTQLAALVAQRVVAGPGVAGP